MAKNKKKNPVGRPPKYTVKILKITRDYITNFKKYGDAIPSIAGLAIALKVNRDTVYDWASKKENKEFSDILEDLLSNQERVLLNNGLTKRFDSSITKLALGKHNYKELKDFTSKDKELNKDLADSINKALDEE